jgi:hypothetical protein
MRLLFDDHDIHGEKTGEKRVCGLDDDQGECSSEEDGDVDVFGIRIPGSGRRRNGGDCDDEDSEEEHGIDEDRFEDEEVDLGNIRRHLLPQLVAFVAESPSKLDLSGLLC